MMSMAIGPTARRYHMQPRLENLARIAGTQMCAYSTETVITVAISRSAG